MYYLKGKTASWLLLGLGVPPALASLPSFEPVAILSSSSTSKLVKDGTAISLSRASKLLSVCSMFLKWHQTWTNKQTKLYQGRPYMLQISYFSFPFFFKSKISTNLDASSNSAPTVHRDSRSYSSLRSWKLDFVLHWFCRRRTSGDEWKLLCELLSVPVILGWVKMKWKCLCGSC